MERHGARANRFARPWPIPDTCASSSRFRPARRASSACVPIKARPKCRGRLPSSRSGRLRLKPVEGDHLSPYDRQPCFRRAAPIPRTIRRSRAALDRLTGGAPDRADNPDAWITTVRRLAPLEARYAPFGDDLDQRLCDVLRQRGVDQLYTHQAQAIEHALAGRHVVVTTPTASGKTLCYNAPVLSTILRDPSARALVSVSHQGAGAGSARRAARAVGSDFAPQRARDRRVHLRRRHATGRPARDSRSRACRAEQPGHGPLGDPAASSAMGEAVREPALRRDRRVARVSRRVRQPPHERAAAPAADLPPLRIDADVRVLVSDHCQPARAGRGAGRAAVRAGLGERRAAW